ncbi:zinc-binding dehydrogenase [Caulobacter hibisci]|uniref:NADP-dependent oxidoreductase n=1 Tax=Caulobacter hibisci TaxID=2035993 RepID=A0ABS0SXP8_9CAUL|nr:NADP-dependent oxidoreductase [Caulobacter hibisci]MBI1684422.1 NADP-dependent oxidoreductase [Caulobacter hibisci]
MSKTLEVVLKRTIEEIPTAADFEVVERAAPTSAPAGQLLVRVLYLSLDPYIGSRLRGRHMGEPRPGPGESLPGAAVAEVIASGHPDFVVGDHVVGEAGWTQVGLMNAAEVRKVDPSLGVSNHLGVLGMPGLTAWAGVTQLAKVGEGDVFTVDAAAGSVGGTAGQIAKILGAKAVGIAGGADKVAQVVQQYGFDAAVDYRSEGWVDQLKALTDGGPTVHFENVGLPILQPVFGLLKLYGRVVLCGLSAHYQVDGPPPQFGLGPIVGKRAQMLGLIVYDFYPRWAEWVKTAEPWIKDGRLVQVEDLGDGIETAPAQFERLMKGANSGKTLVKVG